MARMRDRLRSLAIVGALAAVATGFGPPPSTAASYAQLNGDGSSWAGPAIDQFSKDVRNQGIVVNFNPDGSATGRGNYTRNQADFAATDIQYLTQGDPFGGGIENATVAYSYIPIVAGGTTFLYNLVVAGRKITDLRLSGDTITKIFTGQITNWNDPRITKDYGRALPSQKITPITRSDGSGASYQFTRWMAARYTSQWDAFCGSHGGPNSNCGPTELYPGFAGSQQRGGSDQVANFISADYGAGSIGYDEYAYALQSNIPVVKLLNPAGYYALPTASNVAIALQSATIDENPASLTYLIQNLDKVYTNPDPRSYPLSSYSYLIVPRASRNISGQVYGPPGAFTPAKGAALSTWLNYVLCGAQQKAGALGYSPLPKNLVVGGFRQNANIPGHVAIPDTTQLNGCNNPTYHNGVNYLVRDAPQPSPCDKLGTPLGCPASGSGTTTGDQSTSGGAAASGGGRTQAPTSSGGVEKNSGSGSGQTPGGGGGSGSGSGPAAGSGAGTGPKLQGSRASAAGAVDPDTGVVDAAGQNPAAQSQLYAQPVAVTGSGGSGGLFAALAALELLAALLVPGLLGAWLRRHRRST